MTKKKQERRRKHSLLTKRQDGKGHNPLTKKQERKGNVPLTTIEEGRGYRLQKVKGNLGGNKLKSYPLRSRLSSMTEF